MTTSTCVSGIDCPSTQRLPEKDVIQRMQRSYHEATMHRDGKKGRLGG